MATHDGIIGRSNGLDSRQVGANSLRQSSASVITEAPCNRFECRRRRSLGYHHCIYLIFVVLLASFVVTCESFRQEPVASPRSTRRVLSSQKNLVDDVQEGETSTLQRLLPSAWRYKNMSSWEIVETVSCFRGGGIDSPPPTKIVGLLKGDGSLPPENSVDKAVGVVLTLLGKVVVVQSVATLLTSNDHSLLIEVCWLPEA
jgi:hypothetical protein